MKANRSADRYERSFCTFPLQVESDRIHKVFMSTAETGMWLFSVSISFFLLFAWSHENNAPMFSTPPPSNGACTLRPILGFDGRFNSVQCVVKNSCVNLLQ